MSIHVVNPSPARTAGHLPPPHDQAQIAVEGELDETSTAELETALEEHSAGFTTFLRVDLNGVEWLPSSALVMLVLAMRRAAAAGGGIELVARAGSIAERVLVVTAIPHRN